MTHDILALLRWPELAALAAVVVLMARRWRAWLAASVLMRRIAVALLTFVVGSATGTVHDILTGQVGGWQTVIFLIAALGTVSALHTPPDTHAPEKIKTPHEKE